MNCEFVLNYWDELRPAERVISTAMRPSPPPGSVVTRDNCQRATSLKADESWHVGIDGGAGKALYHRNYNY